MNGDLISRKALKKAVTEATYNFEQIPIRVDKVQEIIDNAPTVKIEETIPNWQIEYCKALFKKIRPQGEWVTDDPTYSTWRCNNCLHVQSICSNFCPSCGTDMRGGEK